MRPKIKSFPTFEGKEKKRERRGRGKKLKTRKGGDTKNLDKFIPCSCSGRIWEKRKIAKMIYSDALKTLKKSSPKIRRKNRFTRRRIAC